MKQHLGQTRTRHAMMAGDGFGEASVGIDLAPSTVPRRPKPDDDCLWMLVKVSRSGEIDPLQRKGSRRVRGHKKSPLEASKRPRSWPDKSLRSSRVLVGGKRPCVRNVKPEYEFGVLIFKPLRSVLTAHASVVSSRFFYLGGSGE